MVLVGVIEGEVFADAFFFIPSMCMIGNYRREMKTNEGSDNEEAEIANDIYRQAVSASNNLHRFSDIDFEVS